MQKYISFFTEKRNKAENEIDKGFYIFSKILSTVKQWKSTKLSKSRNIKKDDTKNILKQQSQLTFNGIINSYEICDS